MWTSGRNLRLFCLYCVLTGLVGTCRRAEGDINAIVAVDGYRCNGQIDQLFLGEMFERFLVDFIGNLIPGELCYGFRPGECGSLATRIERSLAPCAQGIEALF